MSYFYDQLQSHLTRIGASFYLLEELSGIDQAEFNKWKRGERVPNLGHIEKLTDIDRIGLDRFTLEAWLITQLFHPRSVHKACEELHFK